MGGRGIATAGALILLALACVAISRKLDTERRQLGRFPRRRLPLVIAVASTGLVLVLVLLAVLLR
jgi:uncharacterized membrane protein YidH (DUF202 family)